MCRIMINIHSLHQDRPNAYLAVCTVKIIRTWKRQKWNAAASTRAIDEVRSKRLVQLAARELYGVLEKAPIWSFSTESSATEVAACTAIPLAMSQPLKAPYIGLEPYQHGQMDPIYKSDISMWYLMGSTWVLATAYGNTGREGRQKMGKTLVMITTPHKKNLLESWLQDIK